MIIACHDGFPAVCDCAPADGSAFADPGPVVSLRLLADRSTLVWQARASGAGTVWDVMRGSASELPAGSGASEVCVEPGSPDAQSSDASAPAPGGGFYYLVRGRHACGSGSWGEDSSGRTRQTAACP